MTIKVSLPAITPGIMLLRMERLLEATNCGEHESTERGIRLCKKYVEELKEKKITIFSHEEVITIAEDLFLTELYLTLGLVELAQSTIKQVRNTIQHMMTSYAIIKKRMMCESKGNDYSGNLFHLPMDVKEIIVDKLHRDYCF